jgi:hypothetical protein
MCTHVGRAGEGIKCDAAWHTRQNLMATIHYDE